MKLKGDPVALKFTIMVVDLMQQIDETQAVQYHRTRRTFKKTAIFT